MQVKWKNNAKMLRRTIMVETLTWLLNWMTFKCLSASNSDSNISKTTFMFVVGEVHTHDQNYTICGFKECAPLISVIMCKPSSKICKCYLVDFLDWRPILIWCEAWWGHYKEACSEKFGPGFQSSLLHTQIVNKKEDLYIYYRNQQTCTSDHYI